MKFNKPSLSPDEHYSLLLSRGLEIPDRERFNRYLNHISYYRLTGYMYPFQVSDGSHKFKEMVSFDTVLNHYLFDKKLRFLILDAIERIEISIRSNLNNTLSLAFGPYWYLQSDLFNNAVLHQEVLDYLKKYCKDASETFIKSFYKKYTEPELPPSWMVIETLTFGKLASVYENLKDNEQKKQIAASYKVVVPILESWLKSINFIRNCCAHHSRLWNRRIPLKPTIPRRKNNRFLELIDDETDKRLYGILSCILYLIDQISPGSSFKIRLKSLLEEFPEVNLAYMGFPEGWEKERLWQ